MTSDIVLTSALRSNLLSLQNTQRLIDDTQLRLATGLRVNSALDNPQNFFAAQSLNNRAGDLTRLLDGISQSIRTVDTATQGIEALTTLVNQASSIVQSAREELAASEGEARLVGDVDLSDVTDLTTIAGGVIADGSQFTITTTDDDGQQISQQITVNALDTAESLAAQITNAFADNQNGEISARIVDGQFLEIASNDGRTFRLQDDATNSVTLAGFDALGFGDQFADEADGAGGADIAAATIISGSELSSIAVFEGDGDLIEAGDVLVGSTFFDADGQTVISGFAAGDTLAFTVDGVTQTVTLDTNTSFQDVVDDINDSTSAINELVEASFDSLTGQISISSIADDATSIEITANTAGASNFDLSFGDGSTNLDPIGALAGGNPIDRSFAFSRSTVALENFASDFNEIRDQIDRIVVDANFRGVNLLNGDDLTTFFNEDLTSSLVTNGTNFTADGLGLAETNFENVEVVEAASAAILAAQDTIESFGSTLSNNLSIIETRQTFTQQTINTLSAGADDLIVADQNEEGANLLALQTRQALGTTALSLASQSAQSVLRLF